jgi:hypothetical protein
MTLGEVAAALAPHRLDVLGACAGAAAPEVPEGTGTLVLAGPGAGFWPHVTATPEFADGRPDPLDRWSARVLGAVAASLGARPLFPFGGPPWPPFVAWALATGRAWISPVELLVHDTAGLMVSYRGALALREVIDLPPTPERPCDNCPDQPCRTACPVAALTPAGYDVPACRTYVASPGGIDCRTRGCAVRRACPVSRTAHRSEAQSAFHMQAFAG